MPSMNSSGLVLQPCFVDASRAAHDNIQQSSVEASGLVTGQIDHDGDGPDRPRPCWVAKCGRPSQGFAHLSAGSGRRCGPVASISMAFFQAVSQSTPRWRARAETVVSSWARASVAQRTARTVSTRGGAMSWVSPKTPIGQAGSRQRHIRSATALSWSAPRQGASCSIRGAAAASRNHSAPRAAGFDLIRLHRHDHPAVTIIPNVEHVHADNIKERIGSAAPPRNRTTHRVGHRRVLHGTGAWSPLILRAPTPLLGHQHATAHTVTPPSIPKTRQ